MKKNLLSFCMKTTSRIAQNWYIHQLYTRKDFTECLKVIEEQLKACNGQSDYALYIKGKNVYVIRNKFVL